jgi:nuclear pore complex protein Nup62
LAETEVMEKEIDQSLEYIEAQQAELESALELYGQQIQQLIQQEQSQPNARSRYMYLIRTTPADEDREKAYHIAEMLNSKLDGMTSSLSVVIQELNASKTQKTLMDDSPIASIVQVLNDHLTCLEWIERSNQDLETKLERLRTVQEEATVVQERLHKNVNR